MVVLDTRHIFLKPCNVALQTDDVFSYTFGCHVLLAIICSEGDNNAVSVRVNPESGFATFMPLGFTAAACGVIGSGGVCILGWFNRD